MTDLSPAAQAVLNAFNQEARPEPHHQREAIAAALRAAADQVVPHKVSRKHVEGRVSTVYVCGAEDKHQRIRTDFLAIAAELDPTTETP